jgi:hypothetical protein
MNRPPQRALSRRTTLIRTAATGGDSRGRRKIRFATIGGRDRRD